MAKQKKKRPNHEGSIDHRGKNGTGPIYRLRYTIKDRRLCVPFTGTTEEAKAKLRELLGAADRGLHVARDKIKVGQWIDQWIAAGAPRGREKMPGQRTVERYESLLKHVKTRIGELQLQKLGEMDITGLYSDLKKGKLKPMTRRHVHVVFNACMSEAKRIKVITTNPIESASNIPATEEGDHGIALDQGQLAKLVAGFKSSSLFPIVATTAATGLRRNEALALRWCDLDTEKNTLRIERALDFTKKFGITVKAPKTKRGMRTIPLNAPTVAMLLKEREKHLRICAGIPDGVDVDLSLIRLPEGALMFPAVPAGLDFSFTAFRNPRNFSKEFRRRAKLLGFARLRFHDLRGTRATLLLDRGVAVHTVARWLGDDPAVLLRSYAKRTATGDDAAMTAVNALTAGFLGD